MDQLNAIPKSAYFSDTLGLSTPLGIFPDFFIRKVIVHVRETENRINLVKVLNFTLYLNFKAHW